VYTALPGDTTTDYLLCAALPGDTALDYQLYYACRNFNRLSALPTIRSALSSDVLQPNIWWALLCLLILQTIIQSTDYPL
jgi:hypothetical protein